MAIQIRGRDVLERPTCPFCGMLIDRPYEEPDLTLNEMPVGACQCGAVYACDVTGHNLGTAMTEALIYSCKGDWDMAWDLISGKDFMEKELTNYDLEDHLVIHGTMHKGRRITGVLYFIKLREELRSHGDKDLTVREIEPLESKLKAKVSGSYRRKKSSKSRVEALVQAYEVDEILAIARQDKRIIRDLQRLIYSADEFTRWKATDILGQAAGVIAQYDPGAVTKLMQRLFSSLLDTAASSWGAIDAIGDIISNNVEDFGGYLPRLFGLATDRELLPDLVRNFAKIAKKRPSLLRSKTYAFIPLLGHESPEVRAFAAELMGAVGAYEAKGELEALLKDKASVLIYADGKLEELTVGEIASRALDKL